MSFFVVSFYSLSRFLYRSKIPFAHKVITYFMRCFFGVWLPASVQAGKGLVLGYGGLSVVIHHRAILGRNCHIDQCVTIGGTSMKKDVPVIGDNVYVGAGAKILGPVTIGNDVVIGANSVVLNDVPSNCLVVGVPGRVVKTGIAKSDYV